MAQLSNDVTTQAYETAIEPLLRMKENLTEEQERIIQTAFHGDIVRLFRST